MPKVEYVTRENLQKVQEAARRVADILDGATRIGTMIDRPEGARSIVLSDTVARYMAKILRNGL